MPPAFTTRDVALREAQGPRSRLGGAAGGAAFEVGDELGRILGRGQAGLSGADHGEGLIGREVPHGFLERSAREEGWSTRREPQDGFAQAEDVVGRGFEGLGGGIIGVTGDDDLRGVVREEHGREPVRGGEEAVLWGESRKGFQCFPCEGMVAVVAGEGMQANQREGRD